MSWSDLWQVSLSRRLILTALVLLLSAVARKLVYRFLLAKVPDDHDKAFVIHKAASYALTALTFAIILVIWLRDVLGELSVAFGVIGAALAFALQEMIASLAGWLVLLSVQPFGIGDRIELDGIRGDVVDIGLMTTRLLEVGNWLSYERYTGRIVSVPNNRILTTSVFNDSRPFRFIWDEVAIPVTYGSDWRRAAALMRAAAEHQPAYRELLAEGESQLREARRRYALRPLSLEPKVYVEATDNWIRLALIYPVEVVRRPDVRSDVHAAILAAFREAGITIASETIEIVSLPELKVEGVER